MLFFLKHQIVAITRISFNLKITISREDFQESSSDLKSIIANELNVDKNDVDLNWPKGNTPKNRNKNQNTEGIVNVIVTETEKEELDYHMTVLKTDKFKKNLDKRMRRHLNPKLKMAKVTNVEALREKPFGGMFNYFLYLC